MVGTGIKRQNVVVQLRKMLLEVVANNNAGRGCLLVNSAAEFGDRDYEVHQHVKAGFDGMMNAFASLIRVGQDAGHIKASVNPDTYAVILVTILAGLRDLLKGGFSNADLDVVIENILAGLSA